MTTLLFSILHKRLQNNSCPILTKEGLVQGDTPSLLAPQDTLVAVLGWVRPTGRQEDGGWSQKRQKSLWSRSVLGSHLL